MCGRASCVFLFFLMIMTEDYGVVWWFYRSLSCLLSPELWVLSSRSRNMSMKGQYFGGYAWGETSAAGLHF